MFWKTQKAILLVARDSMQLLMQDAPAPVQFSFPAPVVHNLELLDQIGFEKAIQQFAEKENITHTEFTFILDESFLFWKKFSSDTQESDFFDLIPLPPEQLAQKRVQIDTDLILSGYNIALITSIQRALHTKKNSVKTILPFFSFPPYESGAVDIMNVDMATARKSCRYDSDILKFAPAKQIVSAPLIGLIACILLAGGAGIYYLTSQKPKVAPVSRIKKINIPSPTPTITYLDESKIQIAIENGSGRVGEAGKLKTILEKEKYTISTVGNAEKDRKDTAISAKITVPQKYITKLKTTLEEQYQVSSGAATLLEASASADIVITIGTTKVQFQ